MSEAAAELWATFDALPADEQRELLIVLLRRAGELPSAVLGDEILVGLADELFQSLDAEEAHVYDADAR